MKRILMTLLAVLFVSAGAAWAQTVITGRVLDERGQGLPGAGVSVKSAPTVGTVTDLDGNFQLNAPNNATLVIQAVGYASQEIAPGGNTTVRMATAAKELSGAVVTALAIRREKRELGYSATTVTSDELNAGNQVSALSALQGKTAGVNITSSTGGPGGSTRIVLRGEKSIANNNNALIVVDGIPLSNNNRFVSRDGSLLNNTDFGNQANDINPDDIESITVLKGPAAAALYGSQGANGAVMITTKSGRGRKVNGKTDISFTSSYTLSSVLKFPETQDKYGQGNVYEGVADDPRENFSWGLPLDGKLRPWGQEINGQRLVKPYSAQDNFEKFYNTATTWENNLALGGSSEKSSFYIALNTLNNKGIIPNNFYDKYSVRFNGSTEFSNHFYASVNINYINTYSRVQAQGQATGSAQDALLQTPRDIPLWEARDLTNPFYGYGFTDATGVSRYGYFNNFALNPYYVADKFDNRNRTDRVLGNVVVGFKAGNWNVYNRFGGDIVSDRYSAKTPKYNFIPYASVYNAGLTYINGYPRPSPGLGGYTEQTSNTIVLYNDLIAQYTKQLNTDIGFNGLIGGNLQSSRTNTLFADIDPGSNGLVVPDFYSFTNATGPVTVINTVEPLFTTIGLYGSARIDWHRQVFLELTGRNDWTSTLTPNNRSYFYPSVNLSWVFTDLLKNTAFVQNVLTFGKIRGGYASVGNGARAFQNNNTAFGRATVATGFGTLIFPFNGVPGYTYQNTIGNPDLRPERTNSYEVGAELAFFKDRISLDASYYTSKSIDLITTTPVAPSSGYQAQVVNIGEVINKGVELSLRFTPVKMTNGLRWDIYGTFTKNVSEVTRLNNGTSRVLLGGASGVAAYAALGKPYGAFYATDVATDAQGHVIVDSASGTPNIATNIVYKGSYQPDYVASLGTTLTYHGLSFNILFDTKQGGVFYSSTKDVMGFVGTSKETENRDPYVYPNSVYQNAQGNYVTNTTKFSVYNWYANSIIPDGQNIVDASYIKLREVSLSYAIPKSLLKRTPFGNLSLSVFGNNLFIWTPSANKYVDPEVNTAGSSNVQGFDFRANPSLRNYGASLRLTF